MNLKRFHNLLTHESNQKSAFLLCLLINRQNALDVVMSFKHQNGNSKMVLIQYASTAVRKCLTLRKLSPVKFVYRTIALLRRCKPLRPQIHSAIISSAWSVLQSTYQLNSKQTALRITLDSNALDKDVNQSYRKVKQKT